MSTNNQDPSPCPCKGQSLTSDCDRDCTPRSSFAVKCACYQNVLKALLYEIALGRRHCTVRYPTLADINYVYMARRFTRNVFTFETGKLLTSQCLHLRPVLTA